MTLFGQTIAMIVFVWFCMRFIWPPITAVLETRQREIADGLAAAERGRSDLENAGAEAARIIAAARDQARGIIDQANTRAGDIVDEAKAHGEAEKRRAVDSARAEIEVERGRVRDELRGQVGAIAISAAERILDREIDAGAHRDLLDRLSTEI